MKTNTTYTKSQSQIDLEKILHQIKDKGLSISQLKNDPENVSLNKAFSDSLTGIINVLVHEQAIHSLITSIARSYPSQYYEDLKEYDTLFEVISQTFLGLNSVIKKSSGEINNIGRIRIDTYLDKEPEFFVYTLRSYIRNNIILDLARSYGTDVKRTESDSTISEEDGESINKIESVKYNKNNIENNSLDIADSVTNKITLKDDMGSIINAIIERFGTSKPVAGYLFLCIMNDSYDPRTVVNDLKSKDFNRLFHRVLRELSRTFHIDLSKYNNTVFNADKYLTSFRTISDKSARARIDRLASQTRGDVHKLQAFETAKSNHM